jgi:hypothetical protein
MNALPGVTEMNGLDDLRLDMHENKIEVRDMESGRIHGTLVGTDL